jgi:DNA-directed RNA polymerase specialized sigma24 family protein
MSQEPLSGSPESGSGASLFGRELYQFAVGVLGAAREAREAFLQVARRSAEIRRAEGSNGTPLRVVLHRAVWREIRGVIERTSKEREERRQAEDKERRKKLWVNREHYLEISDPLMPDSLVDHAENALSILSDDERPVSILKIYFGFGPDDIARILERPQEEVEKVWALCVEKLRGDLRRTHDTLEDPEPFLKRLRLKGPAEPGGGPEPGKAPTQRVEAGPAAAEPAPATPPSTRRIAPLPPTHLPPQKRLLSRPVLIAAASFAVFAGVAGGFYHLLARTSRQEFDGLVQGIRASHEPTRLSEVSLPDAAEEENSFPLYARAAEAFRTLSTEQEEVLESALWAMQDPREIDPASLRQAAQLVESRADDIALLSDAVSKPYYAPRISLDRRTVTELPHLNGLHNAALALAVRAGVRARLRMIPPPADDLAALVRLCAALRDEPTLGGQLLRVMVVRRTLQAVEISFSQFYFSRTRLEPLNRWIDLDASVQGVIRALHVERAAGLEAFRAIHEGGAGVEPRLSREASGLSAFVYRDASQYVRTMNDIIARLRRGTPSGLRDRDPASASLPPVARMLLAPLQGWNESFARARAHESMIRAAVELRLYKLMHGHYPSAIEELLSQSHSDPFTGGSLRYRRDADGFILYSVGPDGRDDGGAREKDADLVLSVAK